jgi:WD40 repeat protein
MMKRWVTMSHDDKKTVTGRSRDGNGTVTVTGQNHNFYSKRTIQINQRVWSLTMLNTNIHLAAGLGNGDINIYNINDGNLVSSLKGHTSVVNDLVQISADLLASTSSDKTVRIWNLTTNTCKFILTGHTRDVYGLKQITSNILASGSMDRTIKLWDITTGQEIRTLTGHTNSIGWSIDLLNSQTLVSSSLDETIKLWNWSTGECLSTKKRQVQTFHHWLLFKCINNNNNNINE